MTKVEHEPEQQLPESGASFQNLENLADEPPPIIPEASMDPMTTDASGAKPPSPAKSAEEAEDVFVTGTSNAEPGNPTVLAKHSAKEELVERRKVKFDLANYSHLDVNELL